MSLKQLVLAAPGTALDAAAAQTGVATSVTPFCRGVAGIFRVRTKGSTGSPVVKLQGSADNATGWTDVVTLTMTSSLADQYSANAVLDYAYHRVTVTTASGAGDYDAVFEASTM